jgi:hypothetical protein
MRRNSKPTCTQPSSKHPSGSPERMRVRPFRMRHPWADNGTGGSARSKRGQHDAVGEGRRCNAVAKGGGVRWSQRQMPDAASAMAKVSFWA